MTKWMQLVFAVGCVVLALASGIVANERIASILANFASAFAAVALVLVAAQLRQSGKNHEVPYLLAWTVIVGRMVAIFRANRSISGDVITVVLLGVEAWLLFRIYRSLGRRTAADQPPGKSFAR
jgi:hypothetical protein